MEPILRRIASILLPLAAVLYVSSCTSSKYDRLPAATQDELDAMRERYFALIKETESTAEQDCIKLLHHFSRAAQSNLSLEVYQSKATDFIRQVSQGKLKSIKVLAARSPGKVRLLLISIPQGTQAIPFVRGSDGWMIDDIELGFLSSDKEPLLTGSMPKASPSILVAIATLQDVHSHEAEKVMAAVSLSCADCRKTIDQFFTSAPSPWVKTALLYAQWKSGGDCNGFYQSFPIEKSFQVELYQSDSKAYRTLLQGLFSCAAVSKSIQPIIKIYQGCQLVDGGPRSEYVDLLIGNPESDHEVFKSGLANLRPEAFLRASSKLDIPYEEDPVANILVGGLHGEKKSNFVKYIHSQSGSKSKLGRIAGSWVKKMSKRDEMEPIEDQGK